MFKSVSDITGRFQLFELLMPFNGLLPLMCFNIMTIFQEDKYISCGIAEENKVAIGLDCNVGNLYIPPFSKVNVNGS